MSKQQFNNVWDAIEDTPGEAANMKAHAALMRAIAEYDRSSGMTQAEAAKSLAVTQPLHFRPDAWQGGCILSGYAC